MVGFTLALALHGDREVGTPPVGDPLILTIVHDSEHFEGSSGRRHVLVSLHRGPELHVVDASACSMVGEAKGMDPGLTNVERPGKSPKARAVRFPHSTIDGPAYQPSFGILIGHVGVIDAERPVLPPLEVPAAL